MLICHECESVAFSSPGRPQPSAGRLLAGRSNGRMKALRVGSGLTTGVPGTTARPRRSVAPAAILAGGALVTLLIMSVFAPQAHAGESDPRDSPPSQPLAEGRPIFERKGCAGCHSVWGAAGDQHVGPDLGWSGSWRDIMQFAGSLWNHAPAMLSEMHKRQVAPAAISPDEMTKLAAYLFYAKFLDEPGNVDRGRELFQQRSCAECHQLAGRGGTVGPRLDELKPYASSFFMAQALWNHGPEMAAKMAELKIDRPLFQGNDVAHIVALIRGESQAAAPRELAYAQAGSPRTGKALFQQKGCVKCHSIAGTGGTAAPDLGKQRLRPRVAEMAGAFWNHGPTMWAKMKELGVPYPRFSDREMADLLSYLYFVQYMGESGNATTGSGLFQAKSCSQCHAVGGEGPKVGRDLGASDAPRSPFHWASAMWNHAAAVEKARAPQPTAARFEDDEMRDLVEYLRSRGEKK